MPTPDPPPAFTCPRCGAGSWHPADRREGYCARCHDWTAAPARRGPPPRVPGYWRQETSGRLRPAVEQFLKGERLRPAHLAALRAYLRQWIMAPVWAGPDIDALRADVDGLTTRGALNAWLERAIKAGIDPF